MKKFALVLLVLIVAAVAAGAYAAYVLQSRLNEPYRGFADAEVFVDVPSGAGPRAIGERLIAAGVVRDELTFRLALWRSGQARRLQAGEYRFDRPMTPRDVLAKIARGDVVLVPLTFREGLTIQEMAAVFEASGLGPGAAFAAAAADSSLIRARDPEADDLEGYLFPDTYALPRRADAGQVVRLMVDRFREVLTPELEAAADAADLTVRELVTLASLVEKETSRDDERATVAAVYRNRLRVGMGLQCDPTVIYALQKAGLFDGNLRRDDLRFDSPYNTYRYAGLPPGPIAAPGRRSLEAAARPADVDFLYFVSRNDGSHEFARTLAEHNRNVQRFQIEYFRERRLRERAGTAR
jgi:UPF0755 protein